MIKMTREDKLKLGYAKCLAITIKHYENFSIATFFLTRQQIKHISSVYTFLRISDDIADCSSYNKEKKIELLNKRMEKIDECYLGRATEDKFIALQNTIEKLDIPKKIFQDLNLSFINDINHTGFDTLDDLLFQCTLSANPVGEFLLNLFNSSTPENINYSNYICTGIQLLNHWQDLSIDLTNNRVFVPREIMQRFNVTEEMLHKKYVTTEVSKMLEFLINYTEDLFKKGKPLLSNVDNWRGHMYAKAIWISCITALNKLDKNHSDTLIRQVHLSKSDKIKCLLRSLFIKIK